MKENVSTIAELLQLAKTYSQELFPALDLFTAPIETGTGVKMINEALA
jgi:hypothetical protein